MPISKPDMQNIWAEAGAISVPPSADISEGWVVEKPPFEEANFVENRQDTGIAYLFQEGISEWDSYTSYVANSVVKHLGVVYKSLGANTDKQPDVFPANWAIAFDSYGSADQVQQELDALILDDDPFPQYVKEAGAIFTSRAESTSFSADGGLPTGNDSDVGFTFDLEGDTGTFKDGADIVTMLNGVEKLRIKPSAVLLENSNAPVTMADLKAFWEQKVQIQVGRLFLTTENFATPAEVAASLGYGTWTKHAQGRAIVGHSGDVTSASPDWVKTVNSTFGEYSSTLTEAQLPPHQHRFPITNISNSIATGEHSDLVATPTQYYHIPQDTLISDNGYGRKKSTFDAAGGGQAHNNVQPSIVVAIWKRVT
jgi:hypothetical protein